MRLPFASLLVLLFALVSFNDGRTNARGISVVEPVTAPSLRFVRVADYFDEASNAAPPNFPVQFYGRTADGQDVLFDWSSVSINFKVSLTGTVGIGLQDYGNEYNVFINGTLTNILYTNNTGDVSLYTFAVNLDPTESYEILLTKRTEALFGIVTFSYIAVDTSGVFDFPTTPFNPDRRIEFLGDSITCGYGDEGTPPCSFSAATENNYLSYGPLTARYFDADLHLEAWSGKGLVRNYGYPNITSPDPMPSYFNKSVANSDDPATTWNFNNWVPQAVVINLGTNDFSTQPIPPQDVFQDAYVDFITTIQNVYSANQDLQIFLVCGPLISGVCCEYVQNVTTMFSTGVTYINLQGILSSDDYGCNGHPNLDGHFKMFNVTAPIVGRVMNWS